MYLWKLLNQLEEYARNLCYIFGKSFCFNESDCHRKSKHFPFQCACNENETLASYVKGYYNAYEVERMEEFIVFKGALEISSYLEHKIDALINLKVLLYLNIVLITIRMKILILLNMSRGFFLIKKRLMPCRKMWKKKLLKLKAHLMKKRKRVMNKRRIYLLMTVTL
jgi:hypothetical protein